MRRQKLRGMKRRKKAIARWKGEGLAWYDELVRTEGYGFRRVRIHPWSRLSFTHSRMGPFPPGFRDEIVEGLFDTYDRWEKILEEKGEPYDLMIWWHYPRLTESQVVWAYGDNKRLYDNFYPLAEGIPADTLPPIKDPDVRRRAMEFTWRIHSDNDIYMASDFGDDEMFTLSELKRFESGHAGAEIVPFSEEARERYKEEFSVTIPRGKIWVGSRKRSFDD